MRIRRFIVKLALAMVLVVGSIAGYLSTGLSSSEFTTSACACGTVNMKVVIHLDQLDSLVQQYVAEHDGEFPIYEELLATVTDESLKRNLISQVDIASGEFTFIPVRTDVYKIGYAVASDRSDYILLGIGLTEKYKVTYLFGREVGRQVVGYEFPVLHPGDVPPEPSPLS